MMSIFDEGTLQEINISTWGKGNKSSSNMPNIRGILVNSLGPGTHSGSTLEQTWISLWPQVVAQIDQTLVNCMAPLSLAWIGQYYSTVWLRPLWEYETYMFGCIYKVGVYIYIMYSFIFVILHLYKFTYGEYTPVQMSSLWSNWIAMYHFRIHLRAPTNALRVNKSPLSLLLSLLFFSLLLLYVVTCCTCGII